MEIIWWDISVGVSYNIAICFLILDTKYNDTIVPTQLQLANKEVVKTTVTRIEVIINMVKFTFGPPCTLDHYAANIPLIVPKHVESHSERRSQDVGF